MRYGPGHWSFIRLSLLCCNEAHGTAAARVADQDLPPPLPLPGTSPLQKKNFGNCIFGHLESLGLDSAHRVLQQPPTHRCAMAPFEDPCNKQA